MARSVYITSAEGHSGKSSVALGVLDSLLRSGERVGVFRPIARSISEPDFVLELLLSRDGVELEYDDCIGTTYEAVHDDPEAALSTIVDRFKAVEARCDSVVVIGSDYTDVASPTELGFNARIAANLGAPVLLVLTGRELDESRARTPDELRQVTDLSLPELLDAHASLLAVIVNRADPDALDPIIEAIGSASGVTTWAIPEDPLLVAPSMAQLREAVDGRLLQGDESLLAREVLGGRHRRDVDGERAAPAGRGRCGRDPRGSERDAARGAHRPRLRHLPVARGHPPQRRFRTLHGH
jgi:phosphate acetyltransferase